MLTLVMYLRPLAGVCILGGLLASLCYLIWGWGCYSWLFIGHESAM